MPAYDKADIQRRMHGAVEALKHDLGGLRTGRASTALVDGVQVEVYGSNMPLNQVATVSVPEPRLLAPEVAVDHRRTGVEGLAGAGREGYARVLGVTADHEQDRPGWMHPRRTTPLDGLARHGNRLVGQCTQLLEHLATGPGEALDVLVDRLRSAHGASVARRRGASLYPRRRRFACCLVSPHPPGSCWSSLLRCLRQRSSMSWVSARMKA